MTVLGPASRGQTARDRRAAACCGAGAPRAHPAYRRMPRTAKRRSRAGAFLWPHAARPRESAALSRARRPATAQPGSPRRIPNEARRLAEAGRRALRGGDAQRLGVADRATRGRDPHAGRPGVRAAAIAKAGRQPSASRVTVQNSSAALRQTAREAACRATPETSRYSDRQQAADLHMRATTQALKATIQSDMHHAAPSMPAQSELR